jgi:hypothetical protein
MNETSPALRPGPHLPARTLAEDERAELMQRHDAAVRLVAQMDGRDRWDLLRAVVAPSGAYTAAQARAQREAA